MSIVIREMIESDCTEFYREFAAQGWDKPISLFEKYLAEQKNGERKVFVAVLDGNTAGYATLLPNDEHGAFKGMNIPSVCDFNVLEKYQRRGIGNAIFDEIERTVGEYSDKICLGVGLHSGYGSAQRMYIKRGYIPDGSGVWFNNEILPQNAECVNDDDLVLYLLKNLK